MENDRKFSDEIYPPSFHDLICPRERRSYPALDVLTATFHLYIPAILRLSALQNLFDTKLNSLIFWIGSDFDRNHFWRRDLKSVAKYCFYTLQNGSKCSLYNFNPLPWITLIKNAIVTKILAMESNYSVVVLLGVNLSECFLGDPQNFWSFMSLPHKKCFIAFSRKIFWKFSKLGVLCPEIFFEKFPEIFSNFSKSKKNYYFCTQNSPKSLYLFKFSQIFP